MRTGGRHDPRCRANCGAAEKRGLYRKMDIGRAAWMHSPGANGAPGRGYKLASIAAAVRVFARAAAGNELAGKAWMGEERGMASDTPAIRRKASRAQLRYC